LYGIHPDRTGELTTLIGVKNTWRSIASSLVARGGIEPPTPGFSVACSTKLALFYSTLTLCVKNCVK